MPHLSGTAAPRKKAAQAPRYTCTTGSPPATPAGTQHFSFPAETYPCALAPALFLCGLYSAISITTCDYLFTDGTCTPYLFSFWFCDASLSTSWTVGVVFCLGGLFSGRTVCGLFLRLVNPGSRWTAAVHTATRYRCALRRATRLRPRCCCFWTTPHLPRPICLSGNLRPGTLSRCRCRLRCGVYNTTLPHTHPRLL